ncbi:hypothetical protein WA026_002614 [Henosepilachna vigintioctopunctata]|uniref:Centromere protein J C-terminal domain-containing protein n=1 Tax=Henosepilachna vigintioctopunctata TaxID=420089 RepID=A0AAW1U2V4_9CUCU
MRDTIALQGVIQSEWTNGNMNRMVQIDNTEKVEKDDEEGNIHMKSGARKSLSYTPNASEQNLYEKALETELMIFEALERRTEQSGFCSTNTSIIQLLTSSPSRFNFKNTDRDGNCPIFEKIIDTNEDIEDEPVRDENVTLTPTSDRFETASEENDPPHDFRNGAFAASEWPTGDYPELPQQKLSEDDSETEEESDHIQVQNELKNRRDVSVNTDNISLKGSSYSSEQSDSSEEYSKHSHKTYKSCRESPDRSPKTSESCLHCGFLIRNKIEECESELNNLKLEKNKVVAIRKQMARDQKEFENEMETKKKQFEQQKRRLELELEEERKNISEKMAGEMPRRDLKSKLQQRKDREEINDLRIELSETKELMKLRETKNAMSIARLRNQVKILEKSNAELKAENEKLLKEKSKLVAQQKTYNKSTETKMLKEISKNLSKLTEEKMKNQNLRNNSSSEELIQSGCNGDSQFKPKKSSTGIKKTVAFSCHGHGEGPVEENNTQDKVSIDTIEDKCIEEKYKSLFGGQDVIIESISNDKNKLVENKKHTGMNKTEKILEDGTKEIRYSNGNMKLISENGTVRYYYASNDIWHTNFVDGTEVLEFPNGQSEKRFKDGKCLIFFPDGLVQTIFPNGTEEVKYPDGSKLVTKKDGERMLFLSNGQVEIHTKDQKRREYPDGTVKILYPDGSQETRYSNGRIRIKNSEGDIILDTGEQND